MIEPLMMLYVAPCRPMMAPHLAPQEWRGRYAGVSVLILSFDELAAEVGSRAVRQVRAAPEADKLRLDLDAAIGGLSR